MDPRSFIGKRLGDHDIPTPAAVLDRAVVERNCTSMLAAVQNMNLGWRAHIKTHKTLELTRLQVGDKVPVQLIVSTILEAERVLPLLKAYQAQTTPAPRSVNVLYGFPLYAAAVPRLAAVARELGPGGVSVLIDQPDQIAITQQLAKAAGTSVRAFVKVDMGSHRAGVVLGSAPFTATIQRVLGAHAAGEGLSFYGLYCHAGHSYDAREPWAALAHLVAEFTALGDAAQAVRAMAQDEPQVAAAAGAQPLPLVLSVGASPTAASLRHPDLSGGASRGTADVGGRAGTAAKENAAALRAKLDDLASQGYELEVHAGVQPILDLQQLATHAWGGGDGGSGRAETDDLALTVIADVASVYPGRGAEGGDEFLVNAGCLALGREPVKNVPFASGAGDEPVYTGWGVVKPWMSDNAGSRVVPPGADFPRLLPADGDQGWWQVGRISQEHGILTWAGGPPPSSASLQPQLGQRLRIWPNHACIAGAGFSYYLIVNSTSEYPDQIVDVWERWTGW